MLIDAAFYDRPTVKVARELLGKLLVRKLADRRLSGIIVEVEAYLAEKDPASHSYRGLNRKNRSMFEKAGTLYVYSIHAKYCANVVTQGTGIATAVLLRGLEPVEGIDLMRANRGKDDLRELTRGPARLCQALAIDRSLDGISLVEPGDVWIEERPASLQHSRFRTSRSRRIGIRHAQESLLRFYVDGNHFVSGLQRDHAYPRSQAFVTKAEA